MALTPLPFRLVESAVYGSQSLVTPFSEVDSETNGFCVLLCLFIVDGVTIFGWFLFVGISSSNWQPLNALRCLLLILVSTPLQILVSL